MGEPLLQKERVELPALMCEMGYIEGWTHIPLRPEIMSLYGLLFVLHPTTNNNKNKTHKTLTPKKIN